VSRLSRFEAFGAGRQNEDPARVHRDASADVTVILPAALELLVDGVTASDDCGKDGDRR
jgi:hypothetical protein